MLKPVFGRRRFSCTSQSNTVRLAHDQTLGAANTGNTAWRVSAGRLMRAKPESALSLELRQAIKDMALQKRPFTAAPPPSPGG
jgi:hypothetical protein